MKNYLIIFSLVLAICAPLFRSGFYTSQDGPNHLQRIISFKNELLWGNWLPGWVDELNNGKGYPIFYFTYPMPYYLTSLVNLSAIDSLKTILIFATVFSLIFFWKWTDNIAATILFALTPYRFLNLYVRAALGEIVFLPFLLGVFWAIKSKRQWLVTPFVAGMILSHLQLSLIFIPIILIYSYKNYQHLIWGMLMSTFFWLPAVGQLPLTKHFQTLQFIPLEHIPGILKLLYSKWGFGFSPNGMSFQLGIAQIIILIISLFNKEKWNLKFVVLISILLMTEVSSLIWQIPFLSQIQFPWRLLMIPMIFIPFFMTKKLPRIVVVLLCVVAIYTNRNYIRINLPVEEFIPNQGTTTSTPDEFMPLVSKARFESSPYIFWSRIISSLAVMVWGVLLLKSRYGSFGGHYYSR